MQLEFPPTVPQGLRLLELAVAFCLICIAVVFVAVVKRRDFFHICPKIKRKLLKFISLIPSFLYRYYCHCHIPFFFIYIFLNFGTEAEGRRNDKEVKYMQKS